ncbi:cellulose synthase [Devosia sp. WQ 349]|uniref:cellulose synthase n=1 Tax=Devosia sp. WQ 349K1 TaxID=2800329 RepID=UPI001906B7B1|nr:cellulose synthase [Devosia sp. WQ 349K1]MBK1795971.1 cellulose synthase [Devosia sp. WQ 349K1]
MRFTIPLVIIGLIGGVSYAVVAEQGKQRLPHADTPVQTVVAQAEPVPMPEPSAAPVPQGPKVDETALRYFAQQGDTERMNREIERLRALYPNWEPPADPLAQDFSPDRDILRMWELFNAGDYAGTRAAIVARQATDPSFVPTPDLLKELNLAEAQLKLRNASDVGEHQTVITLAANTPELLTCERIDNLWRLADAFVATDADDRAIDAYKYILTNCTSAEERLSTIQKAKAHFDIAELSPLFELEKKDANGVGEFEPLRLDLARAAIASSLEVGGVPVSPADVAFFERSINEQSSAEDLRLFGFYKLERARPNEARRLFEQALEKDPSEASALALAAALLQLRDYRVAEEILAPYSDLSEEMSAMYLDAVAAVLSLDPRVSLDSDALGRMVDAISSTRDANAAQEMGWYAYGFDQITTAIEWFTLSLRWQPDLEKAAYGLLVASNAAGDLDTVQAIKAQWGNRSERIAAFPRVVDGSRPNTPTAPVQDVVAKPVAARPAAAPTSAPRAAASGSSGSGGGGSRSCQNPVPAASLSPGAALSQAWCLMGLNRPAQAAEAFERALQSSAAATRSDAAYGQSLAYMRMGLPDNAAVAAASAPLPSARAVELEIGIMTQKAQTAYAAGDYIKAIEYLNLRGQYAPERNDLLTLRAWSYYHMKLYREARRIFKAVAATGFGDASEGLRLSEQALMIY